MECLTDAENEKRIDRVSKAIIAYLTQHNPPSATQTGGHEHITHAHHFSSWLQTHCRHDVSVQYRVNRHASTPEKERRVLNIETVPPSKGFHGFRFTQVIACPRSTPQGAESREQVTYFGLNIYQGEMLRDVCIYQGPPRKEGLTPPSNKAFALDASAELLEKIVDALTNGAGTDGTRR